MKPPSLLALKGIDCLVDRYAAIEEGGRAALLYVAACRDCAAWIAAALCLRGVACSTHLVLARSDDSFGEALQAATLRHAGASAAPLNLIVCELDTVSFTRPLKALLATGSGRYRVVRMTNCSQDLFELCFQVDPDRQRQINAGVLDKLQSARELQVRSDAGTRLEVCLNPGYYRWVSNHGRPRPGELVLLPSGEVNTYPVSVSGILVADGAFNINRSVDIDARLEAHPLTLTIRDNVVTHWHCSAPALQEFFGRVFADEDARRVAEFGIGTNVGIERFVALNSHINERHPGVHIGFGEHGQPGKVAYQGSVHLDAIAADQALQFTDGSAIHTGALALGTAPHPDTTDSEDTEHTTT